MTLSGAQWARLFDVQMGVMIVVTHKRTMDVLERRGFVHREWPHNRWQITKAGRDALRTAPTAYCLP